MYICICTHVCVCIQFTTATYLFTGALYAGGGRCDADEVEGALCN